MPIRARRARLGALGALTVMVLAGCGDDGIVAPKPTLGSQPAFAPAPVETVAGPEATALVEQVAEPDETLEPGAMTTETPAAEAPAKRAAKAAPAPVKLDPAAQPAAIAAEPAPGQWVAWASCPAKGRAAVIDRKKQRVWLCLDGRRGAAMPTTGARIQPDPGQYKVFYRTLRSSSTLGGHYSTMTHFVAFSRGKRTGARIAFHSMPKLTNGQYVQPLETLGDPRKRGLSSGCMRMLPADAVKIWNFLRMGDTVRVLN